MAFQISSDGLALITTVEQFAAKPYYENAHVATVGWGHALTTPTGQLIDYDVFGRAKADQLAIDAMTRMFGKQEITKDDADAQLAKDLTQYVAAVNRVCDGNSFQCEFDAMVSMCFNIGVAGFLSSAVARLNMAGQRTVGTVSLSGLAAQSKAKANPDNIQLAFARWSNANGAWSLGLYRRRLAEILVYGGQPAAQAISIAWGYKG